MRWDNVSSTYHDLASCVSAQQWVTCNRADGCVLFFSLFMHSSVYPSCPSVCREDVPCHFRCVTLPICHGYLNLSQSDATPLTFSGAMSMMGAEGWSWWHTECERLFGGRRMGRGGGPKGRGLAPIQSQVRIRWCFCWDGTLPPYLDLSCTPPAQAVVVHSDGQGVDLHGC